MLQKPNPKILEKHTLGATHCGRPAPECPPPIAFNDNGQAQWKSPYRVPHDTCMPRCFHPHQTAGYGSAPAGVSSWMYSLVL